MKKWMERAHRDGVYQAKVSRKHPDHPESSPWRHLPNLNPVSRPFMALSLAAPAATSFIANAAIRAAAAFDKVGLEPVAIAGATFVYGIQYYRGVRQETGGVTRCRPRVSRVQARRHALAERRARRRVARGGRSARAVREDHRMIRYYADKYDARERDDEPDAAACPRSRRLELSLASRRGEEDRLPAHDRLPRRCASSVRRGSGSARSSCRASIRHAFASDVHWDAELEPGIVIVHGFGLAISYAAKVRAGCILFQNVTLGFGNDPETKLGGAPLLERNVHVGIGATLYGPIVVGEATKIMAGCVLSRSVPARSIVEAPVPQVAARAPARGPANRV